MRHRGQVPDHLPPGNAAPHVLQTPGEGMDSVVSMHSELPLARLILGPGTQEGAQTLKFLFDLVRCGDGSGNFQTQLLAKLFP